MRRNLKPSWSVCDRARAIYSNGKSLCRNCCIGSVVADAAFSSPSLGEMEPRRDDRVVATFQPQQPEPPGSAEQGLRAGTAERSLHRQQGDSERGFLVPPFGDKRVLTTRTDALRRRPEGGQAADLRAGPRRSLGWGDRLGPREVVASETSSSPQPLPTTPMSSPASLALTDL